MFDIVLIESLNVDSLKPKSGQSKNSWQFFFKYFFGVPHLATFIFIIIVYVIASIAYIHPGCGVGVWTQDLLIMSPLP